MTTLTPRLFFEGKCLQAMEFYRSSPGGELIVTIMKGTPPEYQIREFRHDEVFNARLGSANPDLSAIGMAKARPDAFAATPLTFIRAQGSKS